MADVPEYIMEAARECCAGFFTGHRELYVEDVARAMAALSERERRTAQGVTVPAGWALVPIEPTKDMFRAAFDALVPAADASACYRSMISAAPSLSTSAGGGERG